MGAPEYIELAAPAAVGSHACCVWTHTAGDGGHVQRVLPDGCADVVWVEGGRAVVAGPATEAVLVAIPAGAAAYGVRFGPGAAGPALGVAAHELHNRTVALADIWGADGAELDERLAGAPPGARFSVLAAGVAGRVRRAAEPDPLVTRASRLLAGGAAIAAASRELAVSDRHLRRRFHDAVGYGPKTLQRVLRLRRFLALAEGVGAGGPARADALPLARLAAEAGYADQPHLTRDCTELAGLAPAALLASRSRKGSASPGTSS